MSERSEKLAKVDAAHNLQIKAAAYGALKFGALGAALVALGHISWPTFRRQTPAFKTFLVSAFTMYGVVVDADRALFHHEVEERTWETALRRQALVELGRRGLVATETEIAKWKSEHTDTRTR